MNKIFIKYSFIILGVDNTFFKNIPLKQIADEEAGF